MTDPNYAKAYKEIIEILKCINKEEVNKIPREMLNMFEINQDKNYAFKFDTKKGFEEQNISKETKAILANIFRDYWATDYQRNKLVKKENYERELLEEKKREKYNPKDLFKK